MIIYLELRGTSIELREGETVIGRDIGCGVRFHDGRVSRTHVRLVRKGEQVTVEDLGSTNGSLLNGVSLKKRTQLHDRDAIELGGHQLLFRMFDDDLEQRETVRVHNIDEVDSLGDVAMSRRRTTPMRTIKATDED